jgi:hypothetical protein
MSVWELTWVLSYHFQRPERGSDGSGSVGCHCAARGLEGEPRRSCEERARVYARARHCSRARAEPAAGCVRIIAMGGHYGTRFTYGLASIYT